MTWVPVFRAGTWHGREWTRDELDQLVRNFGDSDPDVPATVGHSRENPDETFEAPALAWVRALRVNGDYLEAQFRDIAWDLVYYVYERRYPKISIEAVNDWHGKKGWTLTRVAYHGGTQTEVPLPDVRFGAKATRISASWKPGSKVRRRAVGFAAGFDTRHEEGGEDDMGPKEIQAMIAAELKKAEPEIIEKFKRSKEYQQVAQRASQAKKLQNESVLQKFAAKVAKCGTFVKELFAAKRITPATANHPGLAAFMASLDDQDKVKFTADQEQTQLGFFEDLLGGLGSAKSLFTKVDDEEERDGEGVDGAIAKFAADHGLDPKLVEKEYRKLAAKGRQDGDDDE
jgi:hypothetical protein